MLWAMHIDDGILRPEWWVFGFAGMGLFYLIGSWRLRDEEIPRIGLLTAVFFVASTIHVRVGQSSAHLLANGLLGVILGWRAGLAISVGLLLQAVLLHHGGLWVIGVNSCIMTLPAFGASIAFRSLRRLPWITHRWFRSLLVGTAAIAGLLSLVFSVTLMISNVLAVEEEIDFGQANALTFHPVTLAAALLLTLTLIWAESRMDTTAEFALGLFIGELTVLATAALNCAVIIMGGDQTAKEAFRMGAFVFLVLHIPLAVIEGIIMGITLGFLARVKPEMLPSGGTGHVQCQVDHISGPQ